jgi:dihydropyrimidinase
VLLNGKFSVFNEWVVTGWPVVTIRRGEVVWENGRITAQTGSGRLAPRARWLRP